LGVPHASLAPLDVDAVIGQRLVELSPAMVALCRASIIEWINPAGVSLLGAPSAVGILGQSLGVFLHDDYRALVDDGLDSLADEDGPIPLKLIAAPQSPPIDVELRVVPVKGSGVGEEPSSNLFMVEVRDIRERVRSAEALRDREAKLQGILDTVAEAIITLDGAGHLLSFNHAAEKMMGYSQAQARRLKVSDILPSVEDMETFFRPHSDRYESREFLARHKSGADFPAEVAITEMRFGKNHLYIGVIRDISLRKAVEEAERRHTQELEHKVEERTRSLNRLSRQTEGILRSASDGIIGVDRNGVITFANASASALMGLAESDLLGRATRMVFRTAGVHDPDEGPLSHMTARRDMYHEATNVTLQRHNGTTFIAEYASRPVDVDGEWVGSVVVFRDITARRQDEERLKVAAAVFETTADGVVVCDSAGTVIRANGGLEKITGWSVADTMSHGLGVVLFAGAPEAWNGFLKALSPNAERDGSVLWEHEFWAIRGDGASVAVRVVVSEVAQESIAQSAADIANRRLVVVISDVTQRKRNEDQIRHKAHYDQLTGLPNRALFADRLEQAAALCKRADTLMGLMFIDLDGFKKINDTLGHDAGDQILKGASARLQSCVRESDTVARLGGDEFTVILNNLVSRQPAIELAKRILKILVPHFDLIMPNGETVPGRVGASIGIAFMPDDGKTVDAVLKSADAAMYAVKDSGKGAYCIFGEKPVRPD